MSASELRPEPFRIDPTFSPRIWGSRSLAPLFPDKVNLPEPIGEAWLTDVHCRVATGPFQGRTLGDAWREMPAGWRGSRFAPTVDFPILVKFIFPADKLSIQVHPDDAYAAAHERAAGGHGKTEMWHAVSAKPGARLLAGLKPGVNQEKFLEGLAHHNLENLFHSHEVHPGDTFFIPARTPHTIGPDMVVCEVQQYSDLTYRVYDYGRVDAAGKARELHIEKALAVMDFSGKRHEPVRALPLGTSGRGGARRAMLAACPYFTTERWAVSADVAEQTVPASCNVLVVLSGWGTISATQFSGAYRQGHCWLLPAALGEFRLSPDAPSTFLRACVPDLAKVTQDLQSMGYSEAEIASIVFP